MKKVLNSIAVFVACFAIALGSVAVQTAMADYTPGGICDDPGRACAVRAVATCGAGGNPCVSNNNSYTCNCAFNAVLASCYCKAKAK